jgi:hypothetical protein
MWTPHDEANAEHVRALFQQWGWDARIEVFEVLYPTLKQWFRHFTYAPMRPDSLPGMA